MRILSSKLIMSAKAGDLASLKVLQKSITKQNYAIPALEAVLSVLEREPYAPMQLYHARLDAALSCLSAILANCDRTPTILKATRLKIHNSVDEVAKAVKNFIINTTSSTFNYPWAVICDNFRTACLVVHSCMVGDDALRLAMCTSPIVLDSLLMIWSTQYRSGEGEPSLFADGMVTGGHIAIDAAELLLLYFQTEEGTKIVIEALLACSKTRRRFAKAFSRRVMCVATLNIQESGMERYSARWYAFWEIAKPMSDVATIHRALMRENYLSAWSYSLASFFERHPHSNFILLYGGLIEIAHTCQGQAVLAMASTHPKALQVFLHILASPTQRSEDNSLSARQILDRIGSYSFYRPVAELCLKVVNALESRYSLRLMMDPSLASHFDKFYISLRGVDHIVETPTPSSLVICDNFEHDYTTTSGSTTVAAPKVCSGCHTVVYCSRACQKEDWERKHRDECPDMRRAYFDSLADPPGRYRYSWRQFHLRRIMTSCVLEPPETAQDLYILDSINRDVFPAIPVNLKLSTFQVDSPRSVYPSLEARADEIIARYQANPQNKLLLEVNLPNGTGSCLRMRVLLERIDHGEEYEVERPREESWALRHSVLRVLRTATATTKSIV